MSTVPGSETWRDAGLIGVDPAEAVELADQADPLGDPPHVPDDADPADVGHGARRRGQYGGRHDDRRV